MLNDSEIIITSIAFGDSHLEISFIEKKDQTPDCGLMKNLVVNINTYKQQAYEIMDIIEEIIDAGLLEIRNPPAILNPRERLSRKITKTNVLEEESFQDGENIEES